jgi:hypothetical protein
MRRSEPSGNTSAIGRPDRLKRTQRHPRCRSQLSACKASPKTLKRLRRFARLGRVPHRSRLLWFLLLSKRLLFPGQASLTHESGRDRGEADQERV